MDKKSNKSRHKVISIWDTYRYEEKDNELSSRKISLACQKQQAVKVKLEVSDLKIIQLFCTKQGEFNKQQKGIF